MKLEIVMQVFIAPTRFVTPIGNHVGVGVVIPPSNCVGT